MDQTNLVFNLRVIRFVDELLPDRYPVRSHGRLGYWLSCRPVVYHGYLNDNDTLECHTDCESGSLSVKPQSHRIVRFLDRTIFGSYGWLRLGQGVTDRQYFATISNSGRIPRSISTRGPAITNDWRISMARAIAGNRATSGSDQPLRDEK